MNTRGRFVIRLNTRQTLHVPDGVGRAEELWHELQLGHIDYQPLRSLLNERSRALLDNLYVVQLLDDGQRTIRNSLPENGQTATKN